MRILSVTSEVAPFSKSGGLGDVTAALGPALTARGHQVMVVSPAYGHLAGNRHGERDLGHLAVRVNHHTHHPRLGHLVRDGVHYLFVHHPVFDRAGLYGDGNGTFGDNHYRFALLCLTALEAARHAAVFDDTPLGDDIVVHLHDWQAALIPLFLDAFYRPNGLFQRAGTVFTVHNLAHQGRFPARCFEDLGLDARWFHPEALEWYGDINFLKAGLLLADQITTVSSTYAQEIATPSYGMGLHQVVQHRARDLTGILNGIDPAVWSPVSDPHLAATYSAEDLTGKAICKASLQADLGLPVDDTVPLVANIGRLDPQKGVELLAQSVPWLVEEQQAQVVFLGSAQPAHQHYEHELRALEQRFPHKVRAWIGYSEHLAHRLEAAADIFAMPSRFEPCGLNQLYSMAYGTVPVVHAVGGLVDSVSQADRLGTTGTGYRFDRFDGFAFRTALWTALDCWRSRNDAFWRIARRGMAQDLSWDARIGAYEDVYRRAYRG